MISTCFINGIFAFEPIKRQVKSPKTGLPLEASFFSVEVPKKDKICHIQCSALGHTAEYINTYFHRGYAVSIRARPRTTMFSCNPYVDDVGKSGEKTRLTVFSVEAIDRLPQTINKTNIPQLYLYIANGVIFSEPKRRYISLGADKKEVEQSHFIFGVKRYLSNTYDLFSIVAFRDIANMVNTNFHKGDYVAIRAYPKESASNFKAGGEYRNPRLTIKSICFNLQSIDLLSHYKYHLSSALKMGTDLPDLDEFPDFEDFFESGAEND